MLAAAFNQHFSLPAMASGYRSLYLDREDLDQENVRLSTFVCWPKWAPKSITKESMAKTGLHFTGDGDMVKCFCCKVALESWKEGDNPLERHRRQSPQCSFLKQIARSYDDDLVVDGEDAVEEYEEEGDDEIDGAMPMSRRENKVEERFESSNILQAESNCSVQSQKALSNRVDKNVLKHENAKLRTAMMCRKCKNERIQTLFLPCRHLVTCEECAEKMDNCIECNQLILGTVRTFMI